MPADAAGIAAADAEIRNTTEALQLPANEQEQKNPHNSM
jgi:hypothetical protein